MFGKNKRDKEIEEMRKTLLSLQKQMKGGDDMARRDYKEDDSPEEIPEEDESRLPDLPPQRSIPRKPIQAPVRREVIPEKEERVSDRELSETEMLDLIQTNLNRVQQLVNGYRAGIGK